MGQDTPARRDGLDLGQRFDDRQSQKRPALWHGSGCEPPIQLYDNAANVDFSPEWYLACHPAIGMDPLEHYTLYGRQLGFLPNGYGPGAVDRDWYLRRYDDLEADVDPAVHYVTRGWREGRDPNPDFSTAWYLACYPNLGMNPLVHYLVWGRADGRLPNGRGPDAVDERWYLARYRDLDRGVDPAVHYAETGWREGRDPNRRFSTAWYLANYPGIGMNPLVHYLQYGRREGWMPRPNLLQTIRSAEWLTWKLGPLFAMTYATALHLQVSLLSAWAPLLIILMAIAPGAAYAAMINDLTDRADDALVGKPNAMAGRSPVLTGVLLACCLIPGAIFLALWRTDPLLFSSYLAAWVIFSLYSFPPFRLKTRGTWGVFAEASASSLFPTLVAVAVMYRWFNAPIDFAWALVTGLWSMAFGVRGILGHQLVDRHNDDTAVVQTFVQRYGERPARQLLNLSFAIEVVMVAAVLLVLGSTILAAVTLAYVAMELFVYRVLRIRTVAAPPRTGAGGRFKLALHSYYQIYFPLGILLQLSIIHPADAVVALVVLLPFSIESLRRERNLLAEAVVRYYYPLQPVFDRPKRTPSRHRPVDEVVGPHTI